MSDEPRQYTDDEVAEHFLSSVRAIAQYWARVPDRSTEERCEGVAFSILVMLDGCSGSMPAFDLSPSPHPDDKQYNISIGENFYDDSGRTFNAEVMLHERFHK